MDDRLVSFCATVKNRASNVSRLLQSLADMEDAGSFEVILADFESDDADFSSLLKGYPYPITWVLLEDAFFNRGQGLNHAEAHAVSVDTSPRFFIDVDMVVPTDFAKSIREHVTPGHCWFPICYSLHKNKPRAVHDWSRHASKANGWWRHEGKGMCGFTKADFDKLGRWNELIGIAYGHEDDNIFSRATDAAWLELYREHCNGLFHVWHPTSAAYRSKHHRRSGINYRINRGKNVFKLPDPPQPTIRVERFEPT